MSWWWDKVNGGGEILMYNLCCVVMITCGIKQLVRIVEVFHEIPIYSKVIS